MSYEREWIRPHNELDCRMAMLAAEKVRDYETAALCAIASADIVSVRAPEASTGFERQAQVYATLHHTQTALWIAENRR